MYWPASNGQTYFVVIICLSPPAHLVPQFLRTNCSFSPKCLKTTLDNLSIIYCQLTESGFIHLSQCLNISQLKVLDLSGVTMTDFSLEIFPVLLEKVSSTLQKLDSDLCGIRDSQCEALLLALSCCSQLTSFSLSGNFLSMAIMEKMLQLFKSQVVSYPSGECQPSVCSPGRETFPASGWAVWASERLRMSQEHLDYPQPLPTQGDYIFHSTLVYSCNTPIELIASLKLSSGHLGISDI